MCALDVCMSRISSYISCHFVSMYSVRSRCIKNGSCTYISFQCIVCALDVLKMEGFIARDLIFVWEVWAGHTCIALSTLHASLSNTQLKVHVRTLVYWHTWKKVRGKKVRGLKLPFVPVCVYTLLTHHPPHCLDASPPHGILQLDARSSPCLP